jgi:hypothetical protein
MLVCWVGLPAVCVYVVCVNVYYLQCVYMLCVCVCVCGVLIIHNVNMLGLFACSVCVYTFVSVCIEVYMCFKHQIVSRICA